MTSRRYVLVEGHGEVEAVGKAERTRGVYPPPPTPETGQ
jgi:hypothetical protein